MAAELRAPGSAKVIRAIARREIAIALRRRLVKLLFLGSLIPPLVMAVILVVRLMIEGAGLHLGWDPLARLIAIQVGPVLFLALAIGTPSVARDRGEDVLFLYATRPVTPWSYTLGKLAAVAFPSVALLFLPGVLIAVLRMGLLDSEGALRSLLLLGKVLVIAVFVSCAYAGICVGASAATKKARWALLVAFAALSLPRMAGAVLLRRAGYSLDAPGAVHDLIDSLFDGRWEAAGTAALFVLLAWAAAGTLVTAWQVRQEMTP